MTLHPASFSYNFHHRLVTLSRRLLQARPNISAVCCRVARFILIVLCQKAVNFAIGDRLISIFCQEVLNKKQDFSLPFAAVMIQLFFHFVELVEFKHQNHVFPSIYFPTYYLPKQPICRHIFHLYLPITDFSPFLYYISSQDE